MKYFILLGILVISVSSCTMTSNVPNSGNTSTSNNQEVISLPTEKPAEFVGSLPELSKQ